jgi:aspartyl-tRNA(Asn)/glutamyl-tRNA(Gln) amidotransferase subunit B
MPPLPAERRARYEAQGISAYDATLLIESREKADYFDTLLAAGAAAKAAANWVNGELSALMNDAGATFAEPPVSSRDLRTILARIDDGTISGKAAKEVLRGVAQGEGAPDAIIEKRGLKQVSDAGALEAAVDQVLAANEKQVADYRAGKDKAFNSLVGQVMKATQGKANPAQVGEILRRRLAG